MYTHTHIHTRAISPNGMCSVYAFGRYIAVSTDSLRESCRMDVMFDVFHILNV